MRPFIVALAAFWVFVSQAAIAAVVDSRDPNFFCAQAKELFPEWDWQTLRKGDRLETNYALVTCRGSSVIVKTDVAFEPTIQWKKDRGGYLGIISQETALVIRTPKSPDAQPKIDLQVVEVTGEVLYSTKRHLIRKNWGALGSSLVKSLEDFHAKQQQRWQDLENIGWKTLAPERELQSWDMIWTKGSGRIEIEILQKGENYFSHASTDVRTPAGEYTLKKRLPEDTYFIMHPKMFRKARVNKIIGEVWVSTDKEGVKRFFEKFQSPYKTRAPQDPATRKRWLESLASGQELR